MCTGRSVATGLSSRRCCSSALTNSSSFGPAIVYARAQGVSEDWYASAVALSCTLSFISGYALTRGSLSSGQSSPRRFCGQPIQLGPSRRHIVALVSCSLVFGALGYYLFQGTPPAVLGLIEFFTNGYQSGINEILSEQRLELTKGHYFGGEYRGQGAVRYLMRIGWPYLTIVSAVYFFSTRRPLWRGVAIAGLVACFVYIGGDGTRGPFLWALVSILVAVSYCVRLRIKTLLCFGAALILLLVTISLPQKLSKVEAAGEHWSMGVQQLSERIFFGNGVNTAYVIEFVRDGYLEQQNGSIHARDFGASLPFISAGTPFTYELFLLQNPNAKSTRTTLSSMTYLGRVYGDFGWLGSVAVYVLLGSFAALLNPWLFRRARTPTSIAFVGLSVMSIGVVNLNGLVYSLVMFAVLMVVSKLYAFAQTMAPRRAAPRRPAPRQRVYRPAPHPIA